MSFGNMTDVRHVLTIDEVAKRLVCSQARVYELLASGSLTRAQAIGRKTVITISSIEALEQAHGYVPAEPEPAPKRKPRVATPGAIPSRASLQATIARLKTEAMSGAR